MNENVAAATVPRLAGVATVVMTAVSAGLWLATARLVYALVSEDTSWAYVVEQTRSGTSALRRFTGLWSGSEGSLLLFASILVTVMLLGFRRGPRWQQAGVGLATAGLVGAVWLGASPFERLRLAPASGEGMAPILEHQAMLVHPPLLYLGLALALAPALVRRPEQAERWARVALAVITVALGLGASWAYVELGWGGWWAWDPIENVGLVVWLLLAAAVHASVGSTGAAKAEDADRTRFVALCALCWPAVFAGAALTRTSMRTSVHAFANAAELAWWLWPLAALAAAGAAIRVWEARRSSGVSEGVGPSIQPTLLGQWPRLAPMALLAFTAVVVAAGTYRPFIEGDATAGWFYSRSLYPVGIAGALLVGLLPGLRRWLIIPGAAFALLAAANAGWTEPFQLLLAAALGAGVLPTVADLLGSWRQPARPLAHLGVLLILVGALGGTAGTDVITRLNEGESVTVEGHRVELTTISLDDGARPEVTAAVTVDDAAELEPSVTFYPSRNLRLPEVATWSRPWLDVMVILRDVDPEAGALLTIRLRPFTQLVWWGVGFIALAALVSMADRRRAGAASPVLASP